MKIRPLHDRLIVKRLEEERKTASGIVIPDTATEKPDQGEIVAVGKGKKDDAGKLIPLAVGEKARTKLMPNVPTLIELGYKDLDVSAWMGLLGPKGMPAAVQARLNSLMNEIIRMPDVEARMNALGIEPVGGTRAEFVKFADAERRRLREAERPLHHGPPAA